MANRFLMGIDIGTQSTRAALISLDGRMYYVDYVRATRSKISVKNVDGSIGLISTSP